MFINCFQGNVSEEINSEGAVVALRFLIQGAVEASPPGQGISRVASKFQDLLEALEQFLPLVNSGNVLQVLEVIASVVEGASERCEELEDLSLVYQEAFRLTKLILKAEALGMGGAEASKRSEALITSLVNVLKWEENKKTEPANQFSWCMQELVQELENTNVENWHSYDENVSFT